jgi:hypothetical protein
MREGLSVEEAQAIVLETTGILGAETIPASEAAGHDESCLAGAKGRQERR